MAQTENTKRAVKGDHLYFNTAAGVQSGEVKSVGQHGVTVHDGKAHRRVYWEHVVGHKKRISPELNLIDKGEDGAIVEDADGRRDFVAGSVPDAEGYGDALAQIQAPAEGVLVTRAIDRAMRDVPAYTVIEGEWPAGNVCVLESEKRAPEILKALESADLAHPYVAVPQTLVRGQDEAQGVLLVFTVPAEALEQFVQTVAGAQRQTALDADAIMVVDAAVNGMGTAPLYVSKMGDVTVATLTPVDGFGEVTVSVSPELDAMLKSYSLDGKAVMFLKGRTLKNGAGLTLQPVTDKAGHQTKRWKRAGEPPHGEPSQARPAQNHPARDKTSTGKAPAPIIFPNGNKTASKPIVNPSASGKVDNQTPANHPDRDKKPEIKPGAHVVFPIGKKQGSGKVIATGADGVTVKDEHGAEHQVLHGDAKPADAGAPGKIAPDKFSAADYFKEHDQPQTTRDDILGKLTPVERQRIKDIEAEVERGTETEQRYSKDGEYTAERVPAHEKVIQEIFSEAAILAAKPKDGQKPTITFLGGRGGSGKSGFKGRVYNAAAAIVLDADAIKEKLPDYKPHLASLYHEESSYLLDKIVEMARQAKVNLVVDATLRTQDKALKRAQAFKDAGYRVEAHYMHLPRHKAAERAAKRGVGDHVDKETGKTKPYQHGRYVPPEVVLGNDTNEGSFDALKDISDKWSFWDNNVEHGAGPMLISGRGNEDETASQKSGTADTGQTQDLFGQEPRSVGGDLRLRSHHQDEADENAARRGQEDQEADRQHGKLKKAILLFKGFVRGYTRKTGTAVTAHYRNAVRYATERHSGQTRGDRTTPYITHPLRVAATLREAGIHDDAVLSAAVLHDTVEDTGATHEDIETRFGPRVAGIVREVTKEAGLHGEESKASQVAHAPHYSKEAKQVKVADAICNLWSTVHTPPKWPKARSERVVRHASDMVQAMGEIHPVLRAMYEHQHSETVAALARLP